MNARIERVKDRMRSWLPRRQPNHFLERLTQQSELMVEGAELLVVYMSKPSKKNAQAIRALEKEADELRRILIDELNRSFVTPIDREDIFALSRALDDVLDYTDSVVNEMDILDVSSNAHLLKMAEMLDAASRELHLAMQRLEKHPNVAEDHTVRAKSIGNRMDTLYAEALAELFEEVKDISHVVDTLKLREIYRHMLHAVGSSNSAANIIGDIVVKFF